VVRILRLRSFPVVAVICRMNRGEERKRKGGGMRDYPDG